MRFLPLPRALLMLSTESPGWAMKNLSTGIDVPGAGPLLQEVPDELCCTSGTKTLYLPLESVYRNGASRVTGLVASVVYVGCGKLCGGAPDTPEKTWLQTAFVQPPMERLRRSHGRCGGVRPPRSGSSAWQRP